ncbi:general glycosylation pathway protein [Shewanella sp. SR44-3]|uniref:general glycosylation pathway protein n=1 Tax=Shewanella sp. SR44-3 TaxID=2760936 RepID=UPI0015F9DB12|nr:general glycosylation pathway protein [Shewanella sp. SR44-3]MBB1268216.1 general glycosylation pathway protein [Shewanella sp. SR44-3]
MAAMSYLSVIERYNECESLIDELLASILIGIGDDAFGLLDTSVQVKNQQVPRFDSLVMNYPFVDLLYLLDKQGTQLSEDISVKNQQVRSLGTGQNCDRSQRPYFRHLTSETGLYVTRPYLSHSTGLCLSASLIIRRACGEEAILVLDVDLSRLIEFMMGDSARRKMSPLFKTVYCFIVIGLFILVLALMRTVALDTLALISSDYAGDPLKPFSIIIYLTLALAIFDLGKTILEEEVLMHKDIFRHSSTRRTITRFISTILIAISIEALLTMFKASLGQEQYMQPAILMLVTVVGLLIGLGVYVYLGAKAEKLLTELQTDKMACRTSNKS